MLPKTLKSAVRWSLTMLLVFLLTEAALFRSGWYFKDLEPDSSAGLVEYPLYWLRRSTVAKNAPANQHEIIVLGDSRVAEGFSSRQASEVTGGQTRFWNFGVPGSSPRDWYYILRDADPSRRRFRVIVIALERYADEDLFDDYADRIIDLNYSIGRLRLSDCPDFAWSMKTSTHRQTALTGCLFKGLTLRLDLRQFLNDRAVRLKAARANREHGLEWLTGYSGMKESLAGLSADGEHGSINYPPGLSEAQRGSIRATVTPIYAPDHGATTRYRTLWLGRILDLYRNSATRIVFMELPRSPLPIPDAQVPARFVQSLLNRRGVTVLPASTFREFERPELFADGRHLNSEGRALMSAKLAKQTSELE